MVSTSKSSTDMKITNKFDLEHFAPYIVSTLSRQFTTLLEKTLRQKGLSISNWRVLLCLSKNEQKTLNEIVDYTFLPQSTLSRSLARMEERKLIVRRLRSDDRRTYNIEITDYGHQMLDNTIHEVQSACEKPLDVLNPEEKDLWMITTKKIIAHLNREI